MRAKKLLTMLAAVAVMAGCSDQSNGPASSQKAPAPSPHASQPVTNSTNTPFVLQGIDYRDWFNDPVAPRQTSLHAINAFRGYEIIFGSEHPLTDTVQIGIIDQGYANADHPDLQGQLLAGSDISSRRGDIDHGQYVLGIMAAKANNGIGTVGVAGMQTKYLYKTLPLIKKKKNGGTVDIDQLADLIKQMGAGGIDVVNVSLAVKRQCQKARRREPCEHPVVAHPIILQAMRDTAAQYGTLFVIAAGNTSDELPAYSRPTEGILVVGASEANQRRTDYSNYGPGVNIYASDDGIYGLTFEGNANHGRRVANGTSYTAPLVTATAGLLKGYLRQNGTLLSAGDLGSLILKSAQNSQLDFGGAAEQAEKLLSLRR